MHQPRKLLLIESLEGRRLLSSMLLDQIIATPQLTLKPAAVSASQASVDRYSPQQIQHAYGFDQISLANGIKGDGSGQTIAIVDAYNNPNIASDVRTFDQQFSLNDPNLTVVNQTGSASALPATDAGWAGEIALDVEWAHAMAPGANILLVEAKSASLGDLMAALDYARNVSSVSVVSMSWGTDEFSLETSLDSHLTTPAGHQGITFVASAGDDGSHFGAAWPSVAPGVLSVGGTTLYTSDSSGRYLGETGWSGSGGGISRYESEPSYQSIIQGTGARTAPDVSFNANPNTGFAMYTSIAYEGYSGWQVAGGTSAGAPQWAALVAIANQGRALNGIGTLDGSTGTMPALYSTYNSAGSYTSNIHDVLFGRTSFFVGARPGYDLVTGLGSPQANQVVQVLIGGESSASPSKRAGAVARADRRNRAEPLVVIAESVNISPPPTTPSPFSGERLTSQASELLATTPLQTRVSAKPVFDASGGAVAIDATPTGGFASTSRAHASPAWLPTRENQQGPQPMFPHHHLATSPMDNQASDLARLHAQTTDAATAAALLGEFDSAQQWKQWGAAIAGALVIGAWAAQRNRNVAAKVRAALAVRFGGGSSESGKC